MNKAFIFIALLNIGNFCMSMDILQTHKSDFAIERWHFLHGTYRALFLIEYIEYKAIQDDPVKIIPTVALVCKEFFKHTHGPLIGLLRMNIISQNTGITKLIGSKQINQKYLSKLILPEWFCPNFIFLNGKDYLYQLVENNRSKILDFAFERGMTPPTHERDEICQLISAYQLKKCFDVLRKHKFNFCKTDMLHYAAGASWTKLVEILIEDGSDVNKINQNTMTSPLHSALSMKLLGGIKEEELIKTVTLLLQAGANQNTQVTCLSGIITPRTTVESYEDGEEKNTIINLLNKYQRAWVIYNPDQTNE